MATVPVRHCYATVLHLRNYLAGTGHSGDWTEDDVPLRDLLEAVSRTIDQAIGWRAFGPVVYTRTFDLGRGALRNDALFRSQHPAIFRESSGAGGDEYAYPDYWAGRLMLAGMVPLGDWLISASTVTAYGDTARTTTTVLTEGIAGDYLLEPYNNTPKHTLKLQENTAKQLFAGQQTLTVAGTWGWQQVTRVAGTLGAAIADATTESITVVGSGEPQPAFQVGRTLLVDSEQLFIYGTKLVERGVNGTTAATHSNGATVYELRYPADVVRLCLELARNSWRERDAGNSGSIGGGDMVVTRPGAEERALLKRLDQYRGRREHGGVFF